MVQKIFGPLRTEEGEFRRLRNNSRYKKKENEKILGTSKKGELDFFAT